MDKIVIVITTTIGMLGLFLTMFLAVNLWKIEGYLSAKGASSADVNCIKMASGAILIAMIPGSPYIGAIAGSTVKNFLQMM